MAFTADKAARMISRAARRRADGSRGTRALWAWQRIVLACGEGDPAVQDAVRDAAPGLPESDVLDLLAAAPEEPADQAAYLTLIGQDAQRQALDPDGSLLALAYRAATPRTRERLRTAIATADDADVVRVVVTGDQRDRVTEMTYEEVDYLAHQLAGRRHWNELRRLAHDLPIAKAEAAARLLPDHERTTPIAQAPERIRATIERLPRDHTIAQEIGRHRPPAASFSPDLSELALSYETHSQNRVETLRMATGEVVRHFDKGNWGADGGFPHSVLHLGDEILDLHREKNGYRLFRVMPDVVLLSAGSGFPGGGFGALRRSSQGAVTVGRAGLKFIDPGAEASRFREVPRLAGKDTEPWLYGRGLLDAVATLPASRLIAFVLDDLFVLDEDGKVLHEIPEFLPDAHPLPTLTFLSPDALAVNGFSTDEDEECTEIWELPPSGPPRLAEQRFGAIRECWPPERWRGLPLDPAFAARVTAPDDGPDVLAVTPGADITATATSIDGGTVEVHSPHLPTARALLERPLLRSGPKDLSHARELRTKITDPGVREALDLLAAHLADRFGGDIALGGPVAAGGPTDIALSTDPRSEAR
ncbi:hypothetical protein [Actinomadura sp. 9N215]|uniref:hypothetical protein n=1 Tax=Actinomadura sp. 9N215 TaxID=3375150 RepID=UPI0037B5C2FB